MMTVKNGKFFKDGEPYPLEFGNKEQIKLIDRVREMRSKGSQEYWFKENLDGFISGVYFQCVCGCSLELNFNPMATLYEALNGVIKKCDGCKFKYEVNANEDGEVLFKLIN